MKNNSSNIIKNLQLVFMISTALLIVSLVSSLYSIQQLAESSKWVNHTNEVIIETENMMSYIKDAESSQRGYVITLDPIFLEPYEMSYKNVLVTHANVKDLTVDNPVQQANLNEAKKLITQRFDQMQRVMDLTEQISRVASEDTLTRYNEMMKGKQVMDELKNVGNRIKNEEKRLLEIRTGDQKKFTAYTPALVVAAALISMLITLFSYVRIKRDMEERNNKQKEEAEKYGETSSRIGIMEGVTKKIAQGDYRVRSHDKTDDQLGLISKALNEMAQSLEMNFKTLEEKNWLQTGSVKVSEALRGERDIAKLSANLINCLTGYLQAPMGTIYVNNTGVLTRAAAYAASHAPKSFILGEGLVGQAAQSKKISVITDLPPDFLLRSSLGSTVPVSLILVPLVHENEIIAVIELGLLKAPDNLSLDFLETISEAMGLGINAAISYMKLQDLLEETQAQAEELQVQHSELENLNSELEAQSQQLQASDEELRVQQEELQQTNEELEERSMLLEEKNGEVIKKAKELEVTTQYKSEFLANMSHELRTPLNSILLLSRLLAENTEKTLTKDQVEYASVIQTSGQGLLGLIDEILDLSKIEAGKMDLEYLDTSLLEITEDMKALFKPIAKEKKLDLSILLDEDLPYTIETDKGRLEQILKNLLSNALKFTSKGSVSLELKKCERNDTMMCFVVKDTGIGIPEDKQQSIFEAFQQADGSTRRKFGGTGLGLSISRELTKLLGGDIHVVSREKKGSEFTLRIPILKPGLTVPFENEPPEITAPSQTDIKTLVDKYIATAIPENIPDDRETISKQDKVILMVEDDIHFAKSLLEVTRKRGYKGIVVVRGDEAMDFAKKYKPVGILLDIELPVKSGWQVIDELKQDPQTRHIPVHIMSSHQLKNESLLKGAADFISKPVAFEQLPEIFKKIEYIVNKDSKKVLIIEDNPKHAKALAYFLESFHINSEVQSNIHDSVDALKKKEVDCVILDMGIPDLQSYQLLEEAKKNPGLENLPIIIFTGKSLSMAEEQRIKHYADSIVVKTAHSYKRMLDEVSLFLHLVEGKQKPAANNDYKKLGILNGILNNKTVLIVDDDVRNIFSLSKSLENVKMQVLTALNGKEALQRLEEHPEVDIVLLDMMMPEMDGYETAKRIRKNRSWKKLPVIAVTAKAMTGDREKCIDAGASDYITKPVDSDQLLSLLRVWLYENFK